jgi:hypothetical protein
VLCMCVVLWSGVLCSGVVPASQWCGVVSGKEPCMPWCGAYSGVVMCSVVWCGVVWSVVLWSSACSAWCGVV